MSQAAVLAEAQAYLLGAGDPATLTNLAADVLREVAVTLPLWSRMRTIINTWTALALAVDQTTTDVTSAAQGAGTPLSTGTALSGHLLGGTGLFDTVVYTVSVAQAGGTPAYTYTYWDGRVWVPLTLLETPDFSTLGTQRLRFVRPQAWVVAAPEDVTLPDDQLPHFWVRVQATAAPTTPATAVVQVQQHTWPLLPDEQEVLALAYYPTDLTLTDIAPALDLAQPTWQTAVGTPRMYTQADTVALAVRLVPLPAAQGALNGLLGVVAGGGAVVDHNLVLTTLTVPSADEVPSWLEGVLALRLAAREASRLGEATAAELSRVLAQVAGGVELLIRETMQEELR